MCGYYSTGLGGTIMSNYASQEYTESKKWISKKITEGFDWESVKLMCTSADKAEELFYKYRDDDLLITPDTMPFSEWAGFVDEMRKSYSTISDPYGLSNSGAGTTLPIPTDVGSPWVQYKRYLLGQKDGNKRISDKAVAQIEKNSHWIINHLLRDTRTTGPRKGLVMGSVQSGKTANMIGLATMAAHYDWNYVIVLSGTIENLRKQTRDRFMNDLLASGGVSWHILDKTGNPDYLVDLQTGKKCISDNLELNLYQSGGSTGSWMHRYVTVCLKNSTRLKNLIKWLHANPAKAARMRILVIDDEADQASINTRKMHIGETEEEFIERTAVNQLIIDLVNGKNEDGSDSTAPFQAMNYISFTATPYANVLNEAFESSLYPKDFICSLPESQEYFGAKVIFGSAEDDKYPGLDIIREIPAQELRELKSLHDGEAFTLPSEFKKSIGWFLCAAAVLRIRKYKKPISMLIHTTSIQNGHFEEYEVLKAWLERERHTGSIIEVCRSVYSEEKDRLTVDKLRACYPDYSLIDEVNGDFPPFEVIEPEIELLISDVTNIMMGEEREPVYKENSIHLCVDNCRANRVAEDGTYLRIVYPSREMIAGMDKSPVFIVMGGNTLARGLTLEGLTCTYFGRNSNQADTLMQMARWFGYRKGYELLQRIWMPKRIREKFELLEKIDEKLKDVFEDYMLKGRSPMQFGPKITTTATIARFLLTSKNKSQSAVECDFDFSGDSYETTKFEDDQYLLHNIEITDELLTSLGEAEKSEVSDSAFIWRDVDFSLLSSRFFNSERYHIYECCSLYSDIPVFMEWMRAMNEEGRYLHWNVAIVGDGKAVSKWGANNAIVGKIERSKKTKPDYIDIGSLRSGQDALCDIKISMLNDKQKALFKETAKRRTSIISNRGGLGMEDTPLLLLYRIDKDLGKDTAAGLRTKLNTSSDIIGFSIIISGEPSGGTHAHSITVKFPD